MRVKRAVAMCVERIVDDDVVATWVDEVPGIADGNNCAVDTQPALDSGSLLTPHPLEKMLQSEAEEKKTEPSVTVDAKPVQEPVEEPVKEVKAVDSAKPFEKGNSAEEAIENEELPAAYESDAPIAKKQRIDAQF